MKLSASNGLGRRGQRSDTSKIDLIPRYPGEHNSYNMASPENKFATIAGINNAKIDNTNPVVKFKFNDKGRGQEALTLSGRVKNNTRHHTTQTKKNQFFINTRGSGNTIELLPSHPSASDNPLNWWSNNVKNTLTQDVLNKFSLEFGYEDGVSLYPLGSAEEEIFPVVIVKNVLFELAKVTKKF